MIRILLLVTLFNLLPIYLSAQHIKGIVLNDNNIPLSYVTVRLLDSDSTFVAGTATDSLGNYQFSLEKKGKFLLSFSCIGYKSQIQFIDIREKQIICPTVILLSDNIMLNEVSVSASSFVRQDNRILIYPDKKQIKHSIGGYDVLYRLMIPEISVDRLNSKVSTIGGEVSLYIDGRKVSSREVHALNPKEIESIEYYDIPSGKYMNDIAAINFITKQQESGGYISVEGNQKIGYLEGNYDGIVKFSRKQTSYTLLLGHSMNKYRGIKTDLEERFIFTDYVTNRYSSTIDNIIKNNSQYTQLNILHRNKQHTLNGKISTVHSSSPNNYTRDILHYFNKNEKIESYKYTNQDGWKTTTEFYGNFQLSENQLLEATLFGIYNKNKYAYDYRENTYYTNINSQEELYEIGAIVNYNITFEHKNSLAVQAYHFHTISSVDNQGSNPYWKHFWEGESLLFLEYNQRFGKKFSLRVGPGFSYIQYSLHGFNKREKLSPRLHFNLIYAHAKNHQIRIACPVGSGYLQLDQLNEVEQQIDSLQIRRGNPNQKIAFQTTPSIIYSGQFNKFNLSARVSYNVINDVLSENFYIENNKLIREYSNGTKFRMLFSQLAGAWKVTENFRLKMSGRWQLTNYKSTPEKLKCFSWDIQADYYLKNFSCGLFAESRSQWIDFNLAYGKSPARYGAYFSWSNNNWHLEGGVSNPFTHNGQQESILNRYVYSYKSVVNSIQYKPSGYIRLAYTFDFGKKTSHDKKNIDKNINSAIFKAN